LTERLAVARARLSATVAQNRAIRARTSHARRHTLHIDDDPLVDARRAAAEMDNHRAALAALADQRAEAVRRAIAGGLSRSDVARSLGVTRQAITKLLTDRPGADMPGGRRGLERSTATGISTEPRSATTTRQRNR
jgi:DNA-binding NarL/FixJ family response regulator